MKEIRLPLEESKLIFVEYNDKKDANRIIW